MSDFKRKVRKNSSSSNTWGIFGLFGVNGFYRSFNSMPFGPEERNQKVSRLASNNRQSQKSLIELYITQDSSEIRRGIFSF